MASDTPPVAEVLRSSAALHRLDDESGMAASILRLHTDEEYGDRDRDIAPFFPALGVWECAWLTKQRVRWLKTPAEDDGRKRYSGDSIVNLAPATAD